MIGLIGRKIGMSQIFDEEGAVIPVSVIEAGPCPVVQVKTMEKDGYNAVQIGFGLMRPTRANLPKLGHFRKANLPPYRYLQEFRVDNPEEFTEGQLIDVSIFKDIATLDVSGKTKGKGFQGVIKRHGFSGGRKTHGSNSHRVPGSIGMAAYPSRVLKGTKLPGRTGHSMKHVRNLKIVEVDTDNNLLLVKGAVPGARNTVLRLTTPHQK
ncbi:MAG: 50S ribosomal protein L3 [Candidatus Krumholzibacteriota bacterium]|nr:50S ribosomal protein L3 [Candidatus Krumholzibacteriota bacterium]